MRAEVFLVAVFVLLGMGAWVGVDRAAARLFKSSEPSEEAELLARGVRWKRDTLSMLEKERDKAGEQLTQARLEAYKQQATLETLPAPAERTEAALAVWQRRRDEVQSQARAADMQAHELTGHVDGLQGRIEQLRREVNEGTREASAEYNRLRVGHRIKKALWTLGGTLALLLAAYVFLSVFVYLFARSARRSGHAPNTWLVVTSTAGLLLVLVAYQTLEMAGAAFFGALVLLYFLWRMPWERAKAEGEGRAAE